LVGLFTPENVGELMMVRDALAANPRTAPQSLGSEPPPLPVQEVRYTHFNPSIPSSF
jgi:hypothetical protein